MAAGGADHPGDFALFDLVGKQLSPRIRDLGKITLYRTVPAELFTVRHLLAGSRRDVS